MDDQLSEITATLLGVPKPEAETQQQVEEIREDEDLPATEAVEAEAEKPSTYTVKELATKLGVEPKELYGSLQIAIGDEQVSLGEYKDRAKELASIDTLNAQALAQKTEIERDYLEKSRALQAAAQRSGVELTEELQAEVKAEYEKYQAVEGQKLLEILPEWSDTDLQRIDLDRIEKTMAGLGFSEPEIHAMVDHRLRLAFHQLGKLQETLERAAKAEVRSGKSQKPRTSRKRSAGTTADLVQAAKDGKVDPTAAIVGLIAGRNQNGSNQP